MLNISFTVRLEKFLGSKQCQSSLLAIGANKPCIRTVNGILDGNKWANHPMAISHTYPRKILPGQDRYRDQRAIAERLTMLIKIAFSDLLTNSWLFFLLLVAEGA